MNSPAGLVTVHHGDNHHFLRWMKTDKEKWMPHYPQLEGENLHSEWFPNRALVGIYLKDMFDQCKAKAEGMGIPVDVVHEEVVDLVEKDGMILPLLLYFRSVSVILTI